MDALVEVLKTPTGDRLALVLIVLGWIAREVVALRRSQREQGRRIGGLESDVAKLKGAQHGHPPAGDGSPQ